MDVFEWSFILTTSIRIPSRISHERDVLSGDGGMLHSVTFEVMTTAPVLQLQKQRFVMATSTIRRY